MNISAVFVHVCGGGVCVFLARRYVIHWKKSHTDLSNNNKTRHAADKSGLSYYETYNLSKPTSIFATSNTDSPVRFD